MTTYTQAVPDANLATNAGFQAYVQHVISMFTNANPAILTRTADTNQIDALTVPTPYTSSTGSYWAALPALFRFYDGLGNDIYIKIRFGLVKSTPGTTSADLGLALIGITLGRGTDGVGKLTRAYDSREFLMLASGAGNVAASRGVKSSYACARDGFLGVLIERDQKTSTSYITDIGHFLGISFKDTGEAFTVYCCNTTYARDPVAGTGNNNTGLDEDYPGSSSIIYPSVAAAFHVRGVKALAFSVETGPWGGWFDTFSAITRKPPVPSLTTGVWNGNTNLFRIDCYHPDVGTWEDPNMLLYYTGDFSPLDTKTISMDATTKTFIFFTPILRAKFPSNCALAMRWE